MDRYQRVEKPRPETPIQENEIRITTQGKMRNYITYATSLLQDMTTSEIVLKAMGRAINKTVTIAEIIKRRVAGLHQITTIGSTDITDTWEPLEEGLLPLEQTRHVSLMTIVLSLKELDTTSTGYQPPLPAELVKPLADLENDGEGSPPQGESGRGQGRGRSRGRGGRGRDRGAGLEGEYNIVDGSWSRGSAHARGRGRGRRFRERGGRAATDTVQDVSGYDDANPSLGDSLARGRGRGRRGRGTGRGRAIQNE